MNSQEVDPSRQPDVPSNKAPPAKSGGRRRHWSEPLRNQTAVVLLVVLVIAGSLLSDVFLTPRNLLNILWAVSLLGIVSLGQTVLLLTARFDMSVAGVVGLAGIVTVLAQINGFGLIASIGFGLGSGVLVGL